MLLAHLKVHAFQLYLIYMAYLNFTTQKVVILRTLKTYVKGLAFS